MKLLKKFTPSDRIKNNHTYYEYINELDMDNGWDSGNQAENFSFLLRLPQLAGKSLKNTTVLDVGCGTGDLVKLLRQESIKDYLGIDIYDPSLERARERYATEIFLNHDLLSEDIGREFDYAFCSGALTLKLSVDNYDFIYSMLEKMWEVTNIGLAINFLTDDDPDPDNNLFFYNPERVISICQTIDESAIVSAVKTPGLCQVTLYMYRESA